MRNTFLNAKIEAMKKPQDHRTRVAAERRSETQEKLLLSGLILASEKRSVLKRFIPMPKHLEVRFTNTSRELLVYLRLWVSM
jgi:hypothetical protein